MCYSRRASGPFPLPRAASYGITRSNLTFAIPTLGSQKKLNPMIAIAQEVLNISRQRLLFCMSPESRSITRTASRSRSIYSQDQISLNDGHGPHDVNTRPPRQQKRQFPEIHKSPMFFHFALGNSHQKHAIQPRLPRVSRPLLST